MDRITGKLYLLFKTFYEFYGRLQLNENITTNVSNASNLKHTPYFCPVSQEIQCNSALAKTHQSDPLTAVASHSGISTLGYLVVQNCNNFFSWIFPMHTPIHKESCTNNEWQCFSDIRYFIWWSCPNNCSILCRVKNESLSVHAYAFRSESQTKINN